MILGCAVNEDVEKKAPDEPSGAGDIEGHRPSSIKSRLTRDYHHLSSSSSSLLTHLTQPGGQGEGEHRGGGDPGVGQGHQRGSLPSRGPHREQVVQGREGEAAGQTLHHETGQF